MPRSIDAGKHQLWRERMKRFRRSKLTVAEFCRSEHVSQASFYKWKHKFTSDTARSSDARGIESDSPSSKHFVPVQVHSSAARLELRFPNGIELQLDADDASLLQAVVQAVASAKVTGSDD